MDFVTLASWSDKLAAVWSMLAGKLGAAWSIIEVLIGFTAVIFVHELGHFLLAKKVGIRVERFAIGFGPRLFGIRKGETDYCINLLPLGGYVKMSGQEDFKLEQEPAPDPRAYNNKSVGARMAVVSAGVIMNVIFAALAFMVVYSVGIKFPPAQIGATRFGSPAYGKILPGDTILMIGDKPVKEFMDVVLNVALSTEPELPVMVQRQGSGAVETIKLQPAKSRELEGLPMLGVEPDSTLKLVDFKAGEGDFLKWLTDKGLKKDDQLIAVNGQAVRFHSDVVRIIRGARGRSVPGVFRTTDGREVAVTLEPELPLANQATDKMNVLGAHPRLEVFRVEPKWPADGVLAKGDVILSYGEQSDPSFGQWEKASEANCNKPTEVRVLRDGAEVKATLRPRKRWLVDDRPLVGVAFQFEEDQAVLGPVDPDSVLGRAGLASGSVILAVTGPGGSTVAATQPTTVPEAAATTAADRAATTAPAVIRSPFGWVEFCRAMIANAGQTVTVSYELNGRHGSVEVAVPPAEMWADQFMLVPPTMPVEPLKKTFSSNGNPLVAVRMGVDKTWQFIQQAYVTVLGLVSGDLSLRHASGPVGIAMVSYKTAQEGWVDLLYFLALISANLAVINFLPLPIVDGGLFTFLVIEKVTRRPVSVRILQISQVIGLVLIGCVFLAVTWQDILRFFIR